MLVFQWTSWRLPGVKIISFSSVSSVGETIAGTSWSLTYLQQCLSLSFSLLNECHHAEQVMAEECLPAVTRWTWKRLWGFPQLVTDQHISSWSPPWGRRGSSAPAWRAGSCAPVWETQSTIESVKCEWHQCSSSSEGNCNYAMFYWNPCRIFLKVLGSILRFFPFFFCIIFCLF